MLVVTVSISRKKNAFRGFRGGHVIGGLINKIIGFLHIDSFNDRFFLQFEIHTGLQ